MFLLVLSVFSAISLRCLQGMLEDHTILARMVQGQPLRMRWTQNRCLVHGTDVNEQGPHNSLATADCISSAYAMAAPVTNATLLSPPQWQWNPSCPPAPSNICIHLFNELLLSYIFVRWQHFMAGNVAELFSSNRGVSHFYAACCINELSRRSVLGYKILTTFGFGVPQDKVC